MTLKLIPLREKYLKLQDSESLFPTNPNIADILGRTNFDFENSHFCFLDPEFPDFQVARFPDWAWLGPDLGWAWLGPENAKIAYFCLFTMVVQWLLFTRFGTRGC